MALCAGLLYVNLKSNIIRLYHFTIDGHFKNNGASWIADASETMALTCIPYLSFQSLLTSPCSNAAEYEARLARYPLISYAARHWGHHASDSQNHVRHLAVVLLQSFHRVSALIQVRWHGSAWDVHLQVIATALGYTSRRMLRFNSMWFTCGFC
jgi:hypothetical protein